MRMKNFWKNDNAIRRSVLTAELSHSRSQRPRVGTPAWFASVRDKIDLHGGGWVG
jgi:hypothetical protein